MATKGADSELCCCSGAYGRHTTLASTHRLRDIYSRSLSGLDCRGLQATPGSNLSQADIEALTVRTQDGGTEVVQAKAGKVRSRSLTPFCLQTMSGTKPSPPRALAAHHPSLYRRLMCTWRSIFAPVSRTSAPASAIAP